MTGKSKQFRKRKIQHGSLIEEKSFKNSQELEVFAPEKEGHTFIGWNKEV